MKLLSILFVYSGIIQNSKEWSFSDESSWPEKYCKKGISQSPIDLVDGENTVDMNGPQLSFENLDEIYDAILKNDGHKVDIELDTDKKILVSGGRLPGTYKLDHFGIHWSSQHTINGEKKALEIESLWCNILFNDCDEAERYKDGQTVFSTIYEFQDEDNDILEPIVSSLEKIGKPKQSTIIQLYPRHLFPNDLTKFYRYWGSFTRPDCIEGKIWTVFQELCKISQNQVHMFMTLKGEDGENIEKAHRDVQNCNSRLIIKMTTS